MEYQNVSSSRNLRYGVFQGRIPSDSNPKTNAIKLRMIYLCPLFVDDISHSLFVREDAKYQCIGSSPMYETNIGPSDPSKSDGRHCVQKVIGCDLRFDDQIHQKMQ